MFKKLKLRIRHSSKFFSLIRSKKTSPGFSHYFWEKFASLVKTNARFFNFSKIWIIYKIQKKWKKGLLSSLLETSALQVYKWILVCLCCKLELMLGFVFNIFSRWVLSYCIMFLRYCTGTGIYDVTTGICTTYRTCKWNSLFSSPQSLAGGFFYVLCSTVLHLLPLRFYCVGRCWDRKSRTVAT